MIKNRPLVIRATICFLFMSICSVLHFNQSITFNYYIYFLIGVGLALLFKETNEISLRMNQILIGIIFGLISIFYISYSWLFIDTFYLLFSAEIILVFGLFLIEIVISNNYIKCIQSIVKMFVIFCILVYIRLNKIELLYYFIGCFIFVLISNQSLMIHNIVKYLICSGLGLLFTVVMKYIFGQTLFQPINMIIIGYSFLKLFEFQLVFIIKLRKNKRSKFKNKKSYNTIL